MKRKDYIQIFVIIIIIFLLFLAILMPSLGKVKYDLVYRTQSLKFWADSVKKYELSREKLPETLCEVFIFIRDDVEIKEIPIVLYSELTDREVDSLKNDPNSFSDIAHYSYTKKDASWFVTEAFEYEDNFFMVINSFGKVKRKKIEKKK